MFQVDWNRYHELNKKNFEDFTRDEQEFYSRMYHYEEHLCSELYESGGEDYETD